MTHKNDELKVNTSIKLFETACTWILGASLLVGVLLSLKILDVVYTLIKNTNINYDYVDIMLELIKNSKDLKHIETLAKIHRVFLLIAIIMLSIYILFRLFEKEQKKLLKFNTLSYIFSVIFSVYLVKLSNDLFYAVKSINTRLYTTDFSKAIYLMQKLQNIKDQRYLIAAVFSLSLVLILVALVSNIYEITNRTDKLTYKKLNITYLSSMLVVLVALVVFEIEIKASQNIVNPEHFFVLAYDLDDKNNIVPVAYVNHKQIERKYIDPYKRDFLEYGLVFDIENKESKDNLKIKVSYDLEKAIETDSKIKNLEFYVKNAKKPEILKDNEKFDVDSLIKLLAKYDTRYISKSKVNDLFKLYKTVDRNGNLEFYLIQTVDVRFISSKLKEHLDKDRKSVIQIMYIGNIFVDENKKVLSYTGMNNKDFFGYETDMNMLNEAIKEMKLVEYVGKE